MNKIPFYRIEAKSATEVNILIYGVIGGDWFEMNPDLTDKKFYNDFKNLELKYDRINVRINSPGGDIWHGLPIFNIIAASKKDVHLWNDGICFSMAAILLEAGKKGKIHAAKNSLFLLHTAMGGVIGNAEKMRDTAEYLDKHTEALMTTLEYRTGMSSDEIKAKWFDYKDHLMTAKEAKDFGFIDIIEDYQAENIPDDISNMSFKDIMNYYKNNNAFDQESFLDKLTNRFKGIFNISNPIQQTEIKNIIIMKDLTVLMAVLAISEIKLTDGKTELTEDQLRAIEAKFGELQQKITDAENAKKEAEKAKKTAEDLLAASESALAETTRQFEAFKIEDAEKETVAKKRKDEIEAAKRKEIDGFEHNKRADDITG